MCGYDCVFCEGNPGVARQGAVGLFWWNVRFLAATTTTSLCKGETQYIGRNRADGYPQGCNSDLFASGVYMMRLHHFLAFHCEGADARRWLVSEPNPCAHCRSSGGVRILTLPSRLACVVQNDAFPIKSLYDMISGVSMGTDQDGDLRGAGGRRPRSPQHLHNSRSP
jgi:hypothetical protein